MTRLKHILFFLILTALATAAPATSADSAEKSSVPQRVEPTGHRSSGHSDIHPENLPAGAEKPDLTPAYSRVGGAITGTAFLPVILADFSDNVAERTLHTPAAFQSMLFQDGYPYGAGSLRDYFQDQSGGLFDVTGQVSQWLRMPRAYSSYVGTNYGKQLTEPNVQTLVRDAAAAADASTNYCKGDTDGDGYVDVLFVVHAGPGAEEGGAYASSRLWSLRWALPTPYSTQDVCANGLRVKISDFTIEPEEYMTTSYTPAGVPARLISMGLFAHEFGHALGLPDLYDIDGTSSGGVGHWDVMASGSWGFGGGKPWRPTPFSAWTKMKLGWVTPQNVAANKLGVAIPSYDAPFSGKFTGVYRLAAGGSAAATEYFLVENRQQTGWARDFPGGGLLVWKIDDGVSGNKNDARRQVQLLAADGLGTASAYLGDAGDLFPGTSVKRLIDGTTTPSTDSYTGADTGVAVRKIGDPGATTLADLIVSATAPATDTTAPTVAAPKDQLQGQVTSTTVQVRVFLSASDPSGIGTFNVWLKENGIWYDKGTFAGTTTSVLFNLPIGSAYQFAVRAKDGAGNLSGYAYGPSFTTEMKDDGIFTLGTDWTRYSWSDSFGGTYITSSTPGTTVTLSFTGLEVALVAPRFASAGRASVVCDGVSNGMIDLYAATLVARQVFSLCNFASSAAHTVKLTLEGTYGRPRFDVDAFAVLR